jgi:transcriptional regulator with XRE-family HTH domain
MNNKIVGYTLRRQNMLTQQYVADYLEISKKQYENIEAGVSALSIDKLEKLANFYKVEMSAILNQDNSVVFNNTFNNQKGGNGFVNENHHIKEDLSLLVKTNCDLVNQVTQLQNEYKLLLTDNIKLRNERNQALSEVEKLKKS